MVFLFETFFREGGGGDFGALFLGGGEADEAELLDVSLSSLESSEASVSVPSSTPDKLGVPKTCICILQWPRWW